MVRRSSLLVSVTHFGFQAFGCVMGMELAFLRHYDVCHGSVETRPEPALFRLWSRHLRRTRPAFCPHPDELRAFSLKTSLDGEALARTSRLTARVDNNAVADGFQLYLPLLVVTKSGEWAVVQQGMNPGEPPCPPLPLAFRGPCGIFVSDPHNAIVGEPQGEILNLVDARAGDAQRALLTIAKESIETSLNDAHKLTMPAHHEFVRRMLI